MLNTHQKERLKYLHSYQWAGEEALATRSNLMDLFSTIETVEELWFASFIVQWEPENGDLDYILDHPLCDKGIALFLYWSLIKADFENNYSVVKQKIEDRILSGNYQAETVAFSPLKFLNEKDFGKYEVPNHVKIETRGVELPLDYSMVFDG